MGIDEIKARLQPMNLSKVAKDAEIHPNVLYRLMKGDTDPKISTIEKLVRFLEKQQ